jgi:hypothetical protein
MNKRERLRIYGHIIVLRENSELYCKRVFDSSYEPNTFCYQVGDVSIYSCHTSDDAFGPIVPVCYRAWKSLIISINREIELVELNLNILLHDTKLTYVRIMNMPTVRKIVQMISVCSVTMAAIDIRGLMWARELGNDFLTNMQSLKTITTNDHISPIATQTVNVFSLPCLEIIGNHFMASTGLLAMEICDMPRLRQIGDSFLSRCDNLKYFSMHYIGIKEIPEKFLHMPDSLTTLELYDMPYVTGMGCESLYSPMKLENLWLASMPSFSHFGDMILCGANSLKCIDLSRLINLKTIGRNFGINSRSLQSVRIEGLEYLESIGAGFAGEYTEKIDIKKLPSLKYIGLFRIRDD